MRVAVVQTDPFFGNVDSNIEDALALMRSVEADLYVLPELFNTGYNFIDGAEVAKFAEPVNGKTFERMLGYAGEKKCYVVYGFAERADRCYNSAALVGPDGLVGLYRKVHLFDRENVLFAPGNLGFPVFNLPFGKIGIMICFDWIYPESARSLALNGALLIAHPSNLVLPHCPDAMVTRCLENRVFAATANRIGTEHRGSVKLTYIGSSEIVSPKGEIMVRLNHEEVRAAAVECDLSLAEMKRINEFNDVLVGRRPDQYHGT